MGIYLSLLINKRREKKTRKLHVLTTKIQRAHFSTVSLNSVVMFKITRQILSFVDPEGWTPI